MSHNFLFHHFFAVFIRPISLNFIKQDHRNHVILIFARRVNSLVIIFDK